jgi:hypothetical protein
MKERLRRYFCTDVLIEFTVGEFQDGIDDSPHGCVAVVRAGVDARILRRNAH